MSIKILDIPTSSISEVKRSPMEVFQKADKEATFSDSEVRGSIENEEPSIDEEDW